MYTPVVGKDLKTLLPEEWGKYADDLTERLKRKQARERAYLDRRAARGTHTPTDEAYEQDQILEDELLKVLEMMKQGAIDLMNNP